MLLSLLALLSPPALAQEAPGSVEIFVFQADTGRPMANATVKLGDVELVTDAYGYASTELPPGSYGIGTGLDPVAFVPVASGRSTEVRLTVPSDGPPTAVVEAPEGAGTAVAPEASFESTAATGVMVGTVVDVDTGKPVEGARIFVRGQSAEAVTDGQGRFALNLPVGPHDLSIMRQGYATQSLTGLEVAAEGDNAVKVELASSGGMLSEFVVTAPAVTGSTALLLDERRESTSVSDVIGAEEMSRAGASNAAAALSRVTGLTVVGGRFVYVRGLGERYSSTTLNGATLPSPDPERRVVPLDLFPASLLDSVVIQKTFSPDMPAEFGGGVVQLRTRKIPDGLVARIGLSGGYEHGTTGTMGLAYEGGKTDWLGIDGGYRALPENVATASSDSPLEEGDMFSDRGYTPEELEKFGESMPNRWNLHERKIPFDGGGSVQIGSGHQLGDLIRVGWLAAATYSQSWDHDVYDKRYFAVGENNQLERSHTYLFDNTSRGVGFGAIGNFGVEIGDDHALQFTTLLNRKTDDSARIYQGENRDVGADIRVSRLRWEERQLAFNQISGSHTAPVWHGPKLEWRYSRSGAGRLEPDRRETRYDNEPGTDIWFLSDRPEGNQRFFSELEDKAWDVGTDVTLPLGPEDAETTPGRIKVGFNKSSKDRLVDTRRFKYMHKGPNSRDEGVLSSDAETVFAPENIGSDGFQFEEITRQTDNYTAFQKVTAFYGLVELPLTPWLRAMGGARLEQSRQHVETFELFNPDQTPVVAELKTSDVLPAGTLTFQLPADMVVRAGYGRTVSRPDFRELSPATFNDVTGGRQTFGNPELERATIDNLDLRWELYPGAGEILSLGGFYKRFNQPIESIVVVSAQHSVSYDNADSATNVGLELEWRKSADLISPALEDFFVAGNVAYIRSRVDLGENAGIQTSNERALQGQSPYVVNVQLGYDNPDSGTVVTVLFNQFGKRINEVGALGAPDTYELGYSQLDVVANQELPGGLRLGVKARNLLNPAKIETQGEEWSQQLKDGWSLGVSLSWQPELGES